jgi:SHS2 domain-containing protein
MTQRRFEEIEHTADWSIRVYGESLNALFTHAAEGMFSLLDPQFESEQTKPRNIELTAIDSETLLVSWLEELLYLLETEEVAAVKYDLQVNENDLQASVLTRPVETMQKDIKAVTYHELEIQEGESGLQTTIVFDV